MAKNNHKLGVKLPDISKNCCQGIQVYIDRERINAIGFYALDRSGRRIDDVEKLDLEYDVMELEVRDIDDIALLMNKETFEKFCELWRRYHE